MITINLLSSNVGMNSSLGGLSALVNLEKVNLIFLQEVRTTSDQIERDLRGFKASVNIDPGSPSSPGTAIVWRQNLPVTNVLSLKVCRIQIASLGDVRLVNIYAPSGSQNRYARSLFFSQDLFLALQIDPGLTVICGGDYNCVLKPEDIEGGREFQQKNCPALKDFVETNHLIDVFRSKHPDKKEYTFYRPGCVPSILDRFYVSAHLFSEIKKSLS